MHALLFGVGVVFPADVVWGPGTVECVRLSVSVWVCLSVCLVQASRSMVVMSTGSLWLSSRRRSAVVASSPPTNRGPPRLGGSGPVAQVGDTGSSFGVRHPHQSSGTARFDTQVLRVARAVVGTESEGDPNSGGRLP